MAYTIYYRKVGETKWKRSKTLSSIKKVAEKTGFEWREVRDKTQDSLQVNPFPNVLIDNAYAHHYQIVKQ